MSLKKKQQNTPLRVRPLKCKHLKKLHSLQRRSSAVVYRRATILLLSWGGKSVQEMVSILGLHVQTVREWIRTFNAAGPERRWKILTPRRPTGRRPTSDDTIAEGLVDLLQQSPKHYGLTGET